MGGWLSRWNYFQLYELHKRIPVAAKNLPRVGAVMPHSICCCELQISRIRTQREGTDTRREQGTCCEMVIINVSQAGRFESRARGGDPKG